MKDSAFRSRHLGPNVTGSLPTKPELCERLVFLRLWIQCGFSEGRVFSCGQKFAFSGICRTYENHENLLVIGNRTLRAVITGI